MLGYLVLSPNKNDEILILDQSLRFLVVKTRVPSPSVTSEWFTQGPLNGSVKGTLRGQKLQQENLKFL